MLSTKIYRWSKIYNKVTFIEEFYGQKKIH